VKTGTTAGKTTKVAAAMSGSEMAATVGTAGTASEHAGRGQHRHAGQNQTDN
jgi:hypothetical protein